MKAVNLRTEYLIDPIGVDFESPRLFWNAQDGTTQSACRIEAFSEGEPIYDSGKVISNSMRASLPVALSSRERVYWRVTLWDENDSCGEVSEEAFFETGLLHKEDWKAKWISGNYKADKKKRYPADCFRKTFNVSHAKKARLYVSACGLYEARINGVKAGDICFAPGSTDYRVRIQYQTIDVTSLLKEGANTLTFEIGDGWYRGSSGSKGRVNTYGTQTKLIAQLEIENENGDTQTIVTDSSFDWSNDGPVEFNDLKDGERVVAYKVPSYSGKAKEVKFETDLTASDNVNVKEQERFHPEELITTPSGKKVLRFPQNLSGYISFRIRAHKGQRIHIRMGEMLDENGEFTQKNIQCIFKGKPSPLQEIDYICKEGVNEYTPKFYYGGFQYALIETDVDFSKGDFEAVAVYSDLEYVSGFECSNPLMNQFYRSTIWSLKSNTTDIPSDCPTRERMGWTGDSHVFFKTASYLTNYAPFAKKHLRDVYDRQWKNGKLPQIAPYAQEDWFMNTMNGSVGWACVGVYLPLYYYEKYGDTKILEDNYEGMLRYSEFMISRCGKWGGVYAKPMHLSHKNRKYAVNAGQSYGEWAEPNDVCAFKWYDFAAPHPEESTAYTYYTTHNFLHIAEDILGKKEDKRLAKIREYSEGAKRAYQELITKKNFSIDTDRQAKLVRPLYMGLLDTEKEEYAKKRLIEALDKYGWRLGTGFLSTPYILYVLQDIDPEYAYRLAENEECPGWLFMPKNGATTIWEAWEGNSTPDKGIASLNHYSKGALCSWLFDSCAGINMGEEENSFVIKPIPGGTLTYAKASYGSIYGMVESGWRKEGNKTCFSITIPSNTTADICLPDGSIHHVLSGHYEFECD